MAVQLSAKGIRVSKGESTIDKMKSLVPHWIHEKIEDPSYVGGFRYARNCTCSECGYESSFEKKTCPHCGVKMHQID